MGKRRIILNAIVLSALIIVMTYAVFADEIEKTIEQKKAAIANIMNKVKIEPYIFHETLEFCNTFLKDFKEQKGIEHIRPAIETDDYDDPKLQPYLSKCPKISLNKKVTYAPRIWEMIKELPKEEQEQYGHVYYATRGFKLYKVNIDNNEKNGDEYVLYAEGFYEEALKRFSNDGQYLIADLETCEEKGGVGTWAQFNYEKKKAIENYNGIIRYKGKFYVFDLYEIVVKEGTRKKLELNAYSNEHQNMQLICAF